MDLVTIKLFVIFGLLVVTTIAACLPLVFILPFMSRKKSSRHSQQGFRGLFAFICLCVKSRSELDRELSVDFTDEGKKKKMGKGVLQGKKTLLFLSIMNCFSGGVFLGTCFLGLMPEVREIFDEVGIVWPKYKSWENSTVIGKEEEMKFMPMTEIVVTCGLFLILIIEQIVHAITDKKHKTEVSKIGKAVEAPLQKEADTLESLPPRKNSCDDENSNENVDSTKVTKVISNNDVATTVVVLENKNFTAVEEDLDAAVPTVAIDVVKHEDHRNNATVRSLILVMSLSMHSLLEGLAIGLQKTASSALSIFVAVLFHKSLMAFSMGNNLVHANQSARNIVIAAFVLATTSPFGIALGLLMKETHYSTEIVNGALQGIATGTFLFITFFEVLAREFDSHSDQVIKTVAFVLGYGSILGVMFTQHAT